MAKIRYESGESDGATAIGHELDTKASLTNASAKLLSIKNAGVEKLAVDKSGNILSAGANSTWVVRPEEGSTGVANALTNAKNAGGGIVQLLKGTYSFTSVVGCVPWTGSGPTPITIQGMGDETIIDVQEGAYAFELGQAVVGYVAANSVASGDTSITITNSGQWYLCNYMLAGDTIVLSGDDPAASSLYYSEANVIVSADSGTGTIQLKNPVVLPFNGTARNLQVWRGSIALKNFKIQYSGTSWVTRIMGFYVLDGLMENITIDGKSKISGVAVAQGMNNTIRNCRFLNIGRPGYGYDTLSMYMMLDSTVENCYFYNCDSATITGIGGNSMRIRVLNNVYECCKNYVIAHIAYGGRNHIISGNRIITCEYEAIKFDTHTPGLIVTDNYIYDAGANAIRVYGDNCVIANNIIQHTGYKHGGNGYGIILEGALPDYALNCLVANNTISDCASGGIGMYIVGKYLTITGNTLKDTGTYGMVIDTCYGTTVSGNSVYNNSGANISVMRGAQVAVTGNSCKKGGTYNISFSGGAYVTNNSIITDNSCNGDSATSYGIYFAGTPSNTGMVVSGNSVYGTTSTSIIATLDESIISANNVTNGITITGTGNIAGLNKE